MLRQLICLFLLCFSAVCLAGAYKWTDEEGRVHYGDRPSTDYQSDEVKVGSSPGNKPASPPPAAAKEQTPAPAGQQATQMKAAADPQTEPAGQDECSTLKAKLEKFKTGKIDFSYETKSGRKITPSKVKVIKAYETEIARACGS
ncbi:MAG: DUF4124 domain-containing protein [Thiotrichales bacterium]|nr:DUF4124 domain-containing protein [Thiotrichales bacterium]